MFLLPKPIPAGLAGGLARSVALSGGFGHVFLFDHEPGPSGPARLFARPNSITPNPSTKDKQGASGVLLSDGRLMFADGGHDGQGAQRVYFYDPTSDSWSTVDTGISRINCDAITLADGTVLITNGYTSEPGSVNDVVNPVGDVRRVQIVDPYAAPPTVTTLPAWPEPTGRGYHSVAMLLKDGRVLIGGGKDDHHATGCEKNELRIFTPPYLASGNPRPVATNFVDGQTMTVGGAPITITYSGNLRATRAVALLAPGSMTHDFDQGQRYVPLAYTNPSAGTLVVTPPETINRAAPGEYLLHLVSDLGVPSTGIYIKLLPPPACVYAIDGTALSYIEAETPSRQAGPLVTVTDATRSGGAYVQVIPGSGSQLSLPDEARVMWYDVNVLADDGFFLWFLANGPDAASNSFWVSVDGNADSQLSLPAGGGWGWVKLSASATTILKGSHTLKIKVRQDGAQIDKVLLTHDPNFVPTGLGGSDLTCNGSPLPPAPTNLAATPGNAQVSLTWNAAARASSYTVKRGSTTGGPYTDFTQTGVTITNFTNTGLANGTTYFYVVTATNAGGESDISSEVSGTPFLPPPPPPPTNLVATAGNGQVSLSWSAAAGATSYNVKRGSTTGGPYTDFIQPGLTTTSFTNTGLANGTAYFYVITASNSNGEGGISNEASATPILPLPGAPTGVTATPGNTQVMLSWTPVSTASSYTVKRGHTSGGPYTDFIQPGITTTSFTNTGLTNGTPYYFVASATNATGEGPNSMQASATPAAAGPAISNLVVNDTANSAKWSIQTNFRVGQLAFGDRTYTIDSIAASVLIGKPWIRTAANSRAYNKTSPPLATFVLTGTTVYLAIDKRWNGSNGRPSWLTDMAYVDTGFDVVVRQSSSVALPHRVWKKTGFASGTTITLPTIGHSAAPLCYTVIVE